MLNLVERAAGETLTFEERLAKAAQTVDHRLGELLPPVDLRPSELHSAMRYSCLAPGKRLRPVLCLLAAQAVGALPIRALDAACAVEMIHCFSLIHDDLPAIDNDDLRRGRPTCHVQFGEAVAILAGDALFALAFDTLARVEGDPAAVLRSMRVLTHAVGSDGLVGGETVDILSEGKAVDRDTLDYIHTRKTGALISAAAEIGAILGGGTEVQIRKLREYGEKIGLAFQIADDVLNETGTPEQLGKAVGSDRERQKATYPALYGLEASRVRALELADESAKLVEGMHQEQMLTAIARYSVERLN